MPSKDDLTMIVNCVVTNSKGEVTVKNVLELHQMNIKDVLIMEKKLNDVVGSRLEEQLSEGAAVENPA